jgi:hypothetical protein
MTVGATLLFCFPAFLNRILAASILSSHLILQLSPYGSLVASKYSQLTTA